MDPPGSSVHGILQARILEWVAISLLQGVFPTQGSNPGLLHRRQILYSLSRQRSPKEHLKYTGILQLLGNSYILVTLQSSSLGNIQSPRFLFLREPLAVIKDLISSKGPLISTGLPRQWAWRPRSKCRAIINPKGRVGGPRRWSQSPLLTQEEETERQGQSEKEPS